MDNKLKDFLRMLKVYRFLFSIVILFQQLVKIHAKREMNELVNLKAKKPN